MTTPRRFVVNDRWGKIPESLLALDGITLADIRIYIFLDMRAWEHGFWVGSQQEIADATGLSIRTIRDAVARMRGTFIEVDRSGADQGTRLHYIVLARTHVLPPVDEKATGEELPVEQLIGDDLPVGRSHSAGLTYIGSEDQIRSFPPPRARANPVLIALEELVTSTVSITLSGPQSDDLAQYAEHMLPEDIPRLREAMGALRSWSYLRGIASRVASDRRNGIDPWRTNGGASTGRGASAGDGPRPGAVHGGRVGTGRAGGDGPRPTEPIPIPAEWRPITEGAPSSVRAVEPGGAGAP